VSFLLENFYKGKYRYYAIIAMVILFTMAFFALVFPQVTKGIDLSGGTILLARTDKPIDSKILSDALSEQFDFVDLSVSSISSPTGYGVTIRFAENRTIASAAAEVDAAKSLLQTDPNNAAAHAQNALNILVSANLVPAQQPASTPALLVTQADLALTAGEEAMLNQIQQTVISKFNLNPTSAFQIKEVSPTLGATFWQTAINVVIIVLVLVIIVVFIFFREIIPSIVVFSCGVFDIIFSLGAMALLGIPLSLSTIPALLMLLGYSIDTDVMVASRVLRRKGSNPEETAAGSMLTGFTMTGTTIAAVSVMVVLSYIYQVDVIFEIGSVLLLGLLGDLIGTWLWSASVLIWHARRKQRKLEKRFA